MFHCSLACRVRVDPLPACLSACMSVCMYVCLSACLKFDVKFNQCRYAENVGLAHACHVFSMYSGRLSWYCEVDSRSVDAIVTSHYSLVQWTPCQSRDGSHATALSLNVPLHIIERNEICLCVGVFRQDGWSSTPSGPRTEDVTPCLHGTQTCNV